MLPSEKLFGQVPSHRTLKSALTSIPPRATSSGPRAESLRKILTSSAPGQPQGIPPRAHLVRASYGNASETLTSSPPGQHQGDSTSCSPRPHLVRKRSGSPLPRRHQDTARNSTSCPPRPHLVRKRSGNPPLCRHQDNFRGFHLIPTSSPPHAETLRKNPHFVGTRTPGIHFVLHLVQEITCLVLVI